MPTFHTLEEALKKFNEKFYSIPDKTCLWHRNVDLRQFLSLVWQSAQEARNRELAEKVENMSYVGVLDSNEKRRGYDICRIEIIDFINK